MNINITLPSTFDIGTKSFPSKLRANNIPAILLEAAHDKAYDNHQGFESAMIYLDELVDQFVRDYVTDDKESVSEYLREMIDEGYQTLNELNYDEGDDEFCKVNVTFS